jgi:hypothetical protein
MAIVMKLFSTFAIFSIIFGCGIMNTIFGLPERYIERDVKVAEMVGTWNVTPNSEIDVNKFVIRSPDWGASAPWKTITLNSDGSCRVELKTGWLGKQYSNDVIITSQMTSCSWNLAKEENPSHTISPVLELNFEYPDNYSISYSLYIFEENGELIVWDFIGDPDDFHPQNFVKVKQ